MSTADQPRAFVVMHYDCDWDYCINEVLGVFTTREAAQTFAALGDRWEIRECGLDPDPLTHNRTSDLCWWFVAFNRDGSVHVAWQDTPSDDEPDDEPLQDSDGAPLPQVYVRATSRNDAIAIARTTLDSQHSRT